MFVSLLKLRCNIKTKKVAYFQAERVVSPAGGLPAARAGLGASWEGAAPADEGAPGSWGL